MGHLKRLTLEMSLKPFKKTNEEYISSVCVRMFEQWKNLSENSDEIAVMLWTADGSEILDYKDELDEAFQNKDITKEQYRQTMEEGEWLHHFLEENQEEFIKFCSGWREKLLQIRKDR